MTEERKNEIALRDKSHLIASDIAIPVPDGLNSYELAVHMTGVKVLDYLESGDYQGQWWMHIEFPNGERYFIHDYYGSCSGCDAFQGEGISEYNYATSERVENPAYAHQLRDFGRQYLQDCMTGEQAIAEASKNLSWDHDAEAMVNWIKEQMGALQ